MRTEERGDARPRTQRVAHIALELVKVTGRG